MRKSFQIGIFFAFIFIILKMVTYFAGILTGQIKVFALINLLFLIVAISYALYNYMNGGEKGNADFMNEIKESMRAGVLYVVIVSGFLFVYYNNIESDFFPNLEKERYEFIRQTVDDPQKLSEIKKMNPAFELMEPDEIVKNQMKQFEMFMSPNFTALLTLLGMLIMSILYSVFVTMIYRKLLFRI